MTSDKWLAQALLPETQSPAEGLITTIASVLVASPSLAYHVHTAAKAVLIRLFLNRRMKLQPVGGGQGCGAGFCVSDPNYPTQETISTVALLRKPLGGGTVL